MPRLYSLTAPNRAKQVLGFRCFNDGTEMAKTSSFQPRTMLSENNKNNRDDFAIVAETPQSRTPMPMRGLPTAKAPSPLYTQVSRMCTHLYDHIVKKNSCSFVDYAAI
jgi:hypothetical protein